MAGLHDRDYKPNEHKAKITDVKLQGYPLPDYQLDMGDIYGVDKLHPYHLVYTWAPQLQKFVTKFEHRLDVNEPFFWWSEQQRRFLFSLGLSPFFAVYNDNREITSYIPSKTRHLLSISDYTPSYEYQQRFEEELQKVPQLPERDIK